MTSFDPDDTWRHCRTSGLMTFLVNRHGDIYEKDLGWRANIIFSATNTRRIIQAPRPVVWVG
jgi:hypothetical protein